MKMYYYLFLTYILLIECAPISTPHHNDTHIDYAIPNYYTNRNNGKSYHRSSPAYIDLIHPLKKSDEKSIEVKLRWSCEVKGPVISTPTVLPLGPNGAKEIFLTTFSEYVEIIGYDGSKPWGWPLNFESSSFRGSPIIYDVDGDGNPEIGIVDSNGNMFWLRLNEYGQYLHDYHVKVPELRVKKDWFVGLDPKVSEMNIYASMFDYNNQASSIKERGRKDPLNAGYRQIKIPGGSSGKRSLLSVDDPNENQESLQFGFSEKSVEDILGDVEEPVMDDIEIRARNSFPTFDDYFPSGAVGSDLFGDGGSGDAGEEGERATHSYFYGYRDGVRTFRDYYGSGIWSQTNESEYVFVDAHILSSPVLADVDVDGAMEVVMAVNYYFDAKEYAGRELDFDPSNYVAGAVVCWDIQHQRWSWVVNLDLSTDKTMFKAYIYGSPTVADLDGDGRSEVIVGTSLGLLYVLDGATGYNRRNFPLQFYSIESQIVVADVLGDSGLEMIVTDMIGNIAIVSASGKILWDYRVPSTLGLNHVSISYAPTVGDVDADGQIDIVFTTSDFKDNIEELHTAPTEPSIEEKEGVSGGRKKQSLKKKSKEHGGGSVIWALNGATGKPLLGYPIPLPSKVVAVSPVVLTDLHDYSGRRKTRWTYSDPNIPPWAVSSSMRQTIDTNANHTFIIDDAFIVNPGKQQETVEIRSVRGGAVSSSRNISDYRGEGLHLIVPTFDGHVFIIDAVTRFTERIDVGEHIFGAMPLVDDISGDGFLDILVSTLNGELQLYETSIPFHPLNSWSSFPKNRMNCFTHGNVGLSIPSSVKSKLANSDVQAHKTRKIDVVIDIFDEKYDSNVTGTEYDELEVGEISRRYKVVVSRGLQRYLPIFSAEYSSPGRYTLSVPINPPEEGVFVVSMTTERGQYYEDVFHIAIGTRFYVWIKFMVLIPVILFAIPMILLK